MTPFSTVSIQTFSKISQKFINSKLSSNFPLNDKPLVQANIDAIGLVDVCFPFDVV